MIYIINYDYLKWEKRNKQHILSKSVEILVFLFSNFFN